MANSSLLLLAFCSGVVLVSGGVPQLAICYHCNENTFSCDDALKYKNCPDENPDSFLNPDHPCSCVYDSNEITDFPVTDMHINKTSCLAECAIVTKSCIRCSHRSGECAVIQNISCTQGQVERDECKCGDENSHEPEDKDKCEEGCLFCYACNDGVCTRKNAVDTVLGRKCPVNQFLDDDQCGNRCSITCHPCAGNGTTLAECGAGEEKPCSAPFDECTCSQHNNGVQYYDSPENCGQNCERPCYGCKDGKTIALEYVPLSTRCPDGLHDDIVDCGECVVECYSCTGNTTADANCEVETHNCPDRVDDCTCDDVSEPDLAACETECYTKHECYDCDADTGCGDTDPVFCPLDEIPCKCPNGQYPSSDCSGNCEQCYACKNGGCESEVYIDTGDGEECKSPLFLGTVGCPDKCQMKCYKCSANATTWPGCSPENLDCNDPENGCECSDYNPSGGQFFYPDNDECQANCFRKQDCFDCDADEGCGATDPVFCPLDETPCKCPKGEYPSSVDCNNNCDRCHKCMGGVCTDASYTDDDTCPGEHETFDETCGGNCSVSCEKCTDNSTKSPMCSTTPVEKHCEEGGCSCESFECDKCTYYPERSCKKNCYKIDQCYECKPGGTCGHAGTIECALSDSNCDCPDNENDQFKNDPSCDKSCSRKCERCNETDPKNPVCDEFDHPCTGSPCDCPTDSYPSTATGDDSCKSKCKLKTIKCYSCWRRLEECRDDSFSCVLTDDTCADQKCPEHKFSNKQQCEMSCEGFPKEQFDRIGGAYGYDPEYRNIHNHIDSASVLNMPFGPGGIHGAGIVQPLYEHEFQRVENSVMQRAAYCTQQVATGTGTDSLKFGLWYFWDNAAKLCRPFTYRNSNGNMNRFRTQTQCEMVCGFLKHIHDHGHIQKMKKFNRGFQLPK